MKNANWLPAILASALGLAIGTLPAAAETETVGGLEWTFSVSDGMATITSGQAWIPAIPASTSGELSIPSTLGGASVVAIGEGAFYCCEGLTSVTIPEGVANLDFNAFRGCSSLASVKLPSSLENIGVCAFYDCGLKSVSIPSSVKSIDEYAFCYCTNLSGVVIPESVAFLGGSVFGDCSTLASVSLPSGLKSIPWGLFFSCPALKEVAIPDGVESIGEEAFCGCGSLSALTIPDGVASVGMRAFDGCDALASLSVPGSWYGTSLVEDAWVPETCTVTYRGLKTGSATVDGVTWRYGVVNGRATITGANPAEGGVKIPATLGGVPVGAIGCSVFSNCDALISVAIPDTVSAIGKEAFYGCSALENITIPAAVASLGDAAFYRCSSLSKATILGNIGNDWPYWQPPFYDCTDLRTIVLGGNFAKIGEYMFRNCTALTKLTIPESVSSIGEGAFDSCTALAELTILGNVTNDWESWGRPFDDCTNLQTVVLGGNFSKIGDWMFSECTALADLTVPDGVATVGCGAFSGTGLVSLSVPGAWYGTDMMEAAAVPSSCEVTYRDLPDDPGGPDEVEWFYTIENGAATVTGADPAQGDLTVPSTLGGCPVTAIGDSAFFDCEMLRSVVFPDSVLSIGESAFESCCELTNVVFGAGLADIGEYAFWNCDNLVKVSIPAAVTNLSTPFLYCRSLLAIDVAPGNSAYESVDGVLFSKGRGTLVQFPGGRGGDYAIPDGVIEIGESAFDACSLLTGVSMPSSVVSIESYAFYACTGLTEVSIPDGVAYISSGAFRHCSGLTAFSVGEGNASFSSKDGVLFDKAMSKLVLYPCGKNGAYDVPAGVTTIGAGAFLGCRGLSAATLPSGLEEIWEEAFSGCSSLAALAIPDGVSYIGYQAFQGCTGLSVMEIPASVAEIGESAFDECLGLAEIRVAAGNPAYESVSGMLFTKGLATLLQCPAGKGGAIAVPDGVSVVGEAAFVNCRAVTELTLPASVTNVEAYAFLGCDALATLRVPGAWEGTDMLADASVPEECAIVYFEPAAEETTSTGVPYSWLAAHGLGDGTPAGCEAAANAPAANKAYTVWQCCAAGLDPADPNAAFTAKIEFVGGKPVVTPDPQPADGIHRAYKTYGRKSLTDKTEDWTDLDSAPPSQAAAFRFFRVSVSLAK